MATQDPNPVVAAEMPSAPIRKQSLGDNEAQAARIAAMMSQIRATMLSPTSAKKAPSVSAAQLAQMCGVDKSKISYRLSRGGLPEGLMSGNRREWTMEEARVWVRELRANGIDTSYVLFADEGHGFLKKENNDLRREVETVFLRRLFGEE